MYLSVHKISGKADIKEGRGKGEESPAQFLLLPRLLSGDSHLLWGHPAVRQIALIQQSQSTYTCPASFLSS